MSVHAKLRAPELAIRMGHPRKQRRSAARPRESARAQRSALQAGEHTCSCSNVHHLFLPHGPISTCRKQFTRCAHKIVPDVEGVSALQ